MLDPRDWMALLKSISLAAKNLKQLRSPVGDTSITATEHRLESLCAAQVLRPVFLACRGLIMRG